MKTLNTIQKLSRLGRIFSRIIYVASLVGAILCAFGIFGLVAIPENFKLGGTTIRGLIEVSEKLNLGTALSGATEVLIMCIGEMILAGMAVRYFQHELDAGTPFTFRGADELKRLGICAICIPVASYAAAEIAHQIFQYFMTGVREFPGKDPVSISLGIMMIVASVLCRYGAELTSDTDRSV